MHQARLSSNTNTSLSTGPSLFSVPDSLSTGPWLCEGPVLRLYQYQYGLWTTAILYL